MKNLKLLPYIGLGAILITGCNGDQATSTTATTGTTSPPLQADAKEVPAEVKTSAFDYYGLGNSKPVDMELVRSGISGVVTGSQSVELEKIENGKAIFTMSHSGGLTKELGSQEVSATKEGVFIESTNGEKLEEPQLDLPADVSPGKSWKNHLKVKTEGSQMDINTTSIVKGVQKFTTKAGPREGLLVLTTGAGTVKGQPAKFEFKSWYVKGLGGVKSVITVTQGGQSQTMTIQEAK